MYAWIEVLLDQGAVPCDSTMKIELIHAVKRQKHKFFQRIENMGDCIIWTTWCDPDGYGFFQFRDRGKKYKIRAHKAALILNGRDPSGRITLHACDRPNCVNVDHLTLGTHGDNTFDKTQKGRQARGSTHGRAKLNESKVHVIKQRLAKGESCAALGRFYRVDRKVISLIKHCRIWT